MKLLQMHELPYEVRKLIYANDAPPDYVFLTSEIEDILNELTVEWSNSSIFKEHNIKTRKKVLLFGETGNGKTTIARHIAVKAGLPFMQISSDFVIDSHIGNTSANINHIFNKIQSPCILFWDEIDSIAKKRSGSEGSGASIENERMVNSILVNMDKLHDDVILIAATNMVDSLDSAFMRRFDVRIEVSAPDNLEKVRFANQLKDYYNLDGVNIPSESDTINSLKSYADVESYYVGVARNIVFEKIKTSQDAKH